MLKLTLERGKGFSRHVEAAAKFFGRLVEDASKDGWARIWVYPRVDALVAGAALFSVLNSTGVRTSFRVSIEPPSRVDIPSVLVGYTFVDYSASSVEAPLVAVAPRIERPPPPNSVYVDGDGSNSGIIGAIITAMGGLYVRRDVLTLIVAGMHYGGKMDKTGKLYGIDEVVMNRILKTSILGEAKFIVSVKAYKPIKLTVCRSLSITINPFYLGFTGSTEECLRSLAALGLENLGPKRLSDLGEDEIKALLSGLLSRLYEETGREVDVREYIGNVLINEAGIPDDYRMFADAILYTVEWNNSPEPLLGVASHFEEEVPLLERILIRDAPRIARAIRDEKPKRLRTVPWLRAFLIDSDLPPFFVWRILSLLGVIDKESVIVRDIGGQLYASGLQIEEALGYGSLRRLKNVKAVDGDSILYKVRQKE